ncbi:MAG: formylmethanofuran--tetrahydromethanopterin formyltransferase [Candidatus Altiarchaeota archaeon]
MRLREFVEDTYAEAFDALYCRILVTADRSLDLEDRKSPFLEYDPLRFLAYRATSTPGIVVGRIEAGIEKFLRKEETPDGREGVILQFYGVYRKDKPLEEQVEKFFSEVAIRIRQDILSASFGTTRVFNSLKKEREVFSIDTKERVGDCGGGYEKIVKEYGKEHYSIPLMIGYDFKIERNIGIGLGISGANLWLFCDSLKTAKIAGKKAIDAIKKVPNVITPFYVCPSGSMVANYGKIGPPTNYKFCPTLKGKIQDSDVPENVFSIPEIVINGETLEDVKRAMISAIKAVSSLNGVKKISAGNYNGKLGQHKIYLKDLFC